jgi:hypothetical protein
MPIAAVQQWMGMKRYRQSLLKINTVASRQLI